MTQMTNYTNDIFEDIKHIDEYGNEFWYARELQQALGYSKWSNFKNVLEKAAEACENSGIPTSNCFTNVGKPIITGKGKQEIIDDYSLNRYACYMIALNGDPRKEIIALAQTYFAVQTRRQELQDEFNQLTEDQRRLAIRGELTEHNKSLIDAAHQAGVNIQGILQYFKIEAIRVFMAV